MAEGGKKLIKSKSGLKFVVVNEAMESPFLLKEPEWMPDSKCSHCLNCNIKFDFFQRRHHCRRCGKCFCSKCCSAKCSLPRMCFVDPVLQCEGCICITTKENDFFDSQLKTLLKGAVLFVTGSAFDRDIGALYMCYLSNDHQCITLVAQEHNPFHSTEPIELRRIENTRIVSSGGTSSGGSMLTGLSLTYTDPDEQPQDIQLAIIDKNSGKQQMLWLTAFQKAIKMMFKGKTGVR